MKNEIVCSDAQEFLKGLPENSVHTCVTSPPYYRLRDYGVDGQIGLEETPEEYIEKLAAVFREVRRVLHPAGTCWVVIGDSYNGSGGAGGDYGPGGMKEGRQKYPGKRIKTLKPKDLIGIPWTLAFALREDGWWLRQCVTWEKPNALLEPVTDRPATCHEYIFLFAKSKKYFYDYLAAVESLGKQCSEGKRLQSVWRIPAEGFSAKKYGLDIEHYAVFPEALAERCIRLSTSEVGVCGKCAMPWVRIVEKKDLGYAKRRTVGWGPSCACGADTVPALVLDPFCGSGTALAVAKRLNRDYLGCDLNPDYVRLAKARVEREIAQLSFAF